MSLCNVEAVVIKHRALGEADKLLTLFSRERGKIRAVARGSRRPRNRFLATSQPFSHSELQLYRGKGLYYISQSQLITSFYFLREELERMAAASYISELVDALVQEGYALPRLFALLVSTLHMLTGMPGVGPPLRYFELGLLLEVGMLPNWDRCADCGGELSGTGLAVSGALGGLLCSRCRGNDPASLPVQGTTMTMLRQLPSFTPRGLASLRLQPQVAAELERSLELLLKKAGAGQLKSRAFLAREYGSPGSR